jgi:hypothetical protein
MRSKGHTESRSRINRLKRCLSKKPRALAQTEHTPPRSCIARSWRLGFFAFARSSSDSLSVSAAAPLVHAASAPSGMSSRLRLWWLWEVAESSKPEGPALSSSALPRQHSWPLGEAPLGNSAGLPVSHVALGARPGGDSESEDEASAKKSGSTFRARSSVKALLSSTCRLTAQVKSYSGGQIELRGTVLSEH